MSKQSFITVLALLVVPLAVSSKTMGQISPNSDPSLVGWWTFDDGQGTVATDSSPSGNNGELMNGGTWSTGQIGGALLLDGDDDYVQLDIGDLVPTLQECTITIWVNWAGGANWQRFIDIGTGTAAYLYFCPATDADNNMRIALVAGNGVWDEIFASEPLATDEWKHVAVTVSDSAAEMNLYVDGELVGTTTGLTNSVDDLGNTTNNWIGRSQYAADATFNGTVDDMRIYNQILSEEDIVRVMLGISEAAAGPQPARGSTDIPRDTVMTWLPGENAVSHDVYFGYSFEDVNTATRADQKGVLLSQGQPNTEYDPEGLLPFGATVYWRIDEIQAGGALVPGSVWSFTTEPYSYLVPDVNAVASIPSNAGSEVAHLVDGSGLLSEGGHSIDSADMWQATLPDGGVVLDFSFNRLYKLDEARVWNYNFQWEPYLFFSTKGMTVQYAAEPNDWVTLGEFELAQGPGAATIAPVSLDFGGAAARYVRFIINSSYGGSDVGLSEVQFMFIPTFAREPEPASGSLNVAPDAALSWRAGRGVVTHQIHLGTDPNAVAAGRSLAAVSNVPSYSGSLLGLTLDQKYYWMITEVNNSATPTSWNSEVWDFNTPAFIVIDDMESYDDEENRIYYSWIDGLDDPTNGGSQVGPDDPPFTSQDIVHGGDQALLLKFGKSNKTTSEADLTLPSAQNWKRAGITTLVIWFRGQAGNATPQLYAKINNTTINYTGSAGSLAAPVWKQWNIDLASVGAASNVTSLSLGVSGAGAGTLYFDDIRLYKDAGPQTGNAVNPGTTGLMAYYPMNDSVADASGKGYNGTVEVGSTFGAGPTGYGRALVLDGTSGLATLPIGPVVQSANGITVGSWFRVDTSRTWARLFDFNDGTTDVYMFFAPTNGSVSRFAITTGSNAAGAESTLSGPAIGADGLWHHVAVTIDGVTSEMKLYIDGALADSGMTATLPSALGNTTSNFIGQSAYDDPLFAGSVDEFYIFNRALSAGEVQYLVGDR